MENQFFIRVHLRPSVVAKYTLTLYSSSFLKQTAAEEVSRSFRHQI